MKLESPPAADAEEGSMTSSRSPSLIFRIPFLIIPHLTRHKVRPPRFSFLHSEKIGGKPQIKSILIIHGGFSREDCALKGFETLAVSRDGPRSPECWSSGFLTGKPVAQLEICQMQI
jgi:hypothetical protein